MTWNYNTPGGEPDFTDATAWHNQMVRQADAILRQLVGEILSKPARLVSDAELEGFRDDLAYVDPTKTAPPEDATTGPVAPWSGFPLGVTRRSWPDITMTDDSDDPDGYYRAVEQLGHEDVGKLYDRAGNELQYPVRHRQDEYLEWAVSPDRRKIAFVAEGYDYYAALFRDNEQAVVDLYRNFTENNAITADDLRAPQDIYEPRQGMLRLMVKEGEFNPRNRFNLANGRIVHLSHRANSLGAEINLAGVSSLARKDYQGNLVSASSSEKVICCNHSGAINRNSDPSISHAAYGLVLGYQRFTLADPVGLYIAGARYKSVELPGGTAPVPKEWWSVVRGQGDLETTNSNRILRLELEVPEGEMLDGRQMTLYDLEIGGGPARYPGQFAELVDVQLFVTSWPRGSDSVGPIVDCVGTCCQQSGSALVFPSTDQCPVGFDDKYPGHIEPKPFPVSVAEIETSADIDDLRRT